MFVYVFLFVVLFTTIGGVWGATPEKAVYISQAWDVISPKTHIVFFRNVNTLQWWVYEQYYINTTKC